MTKSCYLFSTIGRKQMMALAGLLLCGFVLTHAAGNMLIFVGAEAYNKYSHALVTNPLIYIAEAGLIAFFLVHILAAVVVTIRNRCSRQQDYAVRSSGEKRTSWTTKTMWLQGITILAFVILHLITFKFGTYYETTIGAIPMRDLYRLVIEVFQSAGYTLFYVLVVTILGFHLSHGFYSALQTFGLNHPKYTPKLKCISVLYGVLVTALFVSQPVYVYFFHGA